MTSASYTVQGMTCDHCVGSVTAEVTKISGITDISVDVAAGRLTVSSDEPISDAAIVEAVEEAGYQIVDA